MAAGAYPLRRPPYAWSPGAPAPPGPCYWLVASGTPLGWRGGCLAQGLGRGAVRHYCLGGCSAPSVCARRSRPVRGGSGRYLASCFFRFPLPAPRVPRCVWRGVPSGCPLPSLAGTPFHAVCAFRALGSVALPVVPARPFRVCALALSRCVSAANPHLLRFSQICPRLTTFWSFSLLRRNRRLAAQSQDQTYIFLMCRI